MAVALISITGQEPKIDFYSFLLLSFLIFLLLSVLILAGWGSICGGVSQPFIPEGSESSVAQHSFLN